MKLPRNIFALADLVGYIARQTSGYDPKTMQGACFACSAVLASAINTFGFGRAEVELYWEAHRGHAWTRVSFRERRPRKEVVIDLTFTQYDFDAPHVYAVGCESREFDAYLRCVSGMSHKTAEVHVARGVLARDTLRLAGIDTSKLYYILEKLEGLA